jgi:hypothetical protein
VLPELINRYLLKCLEYLIRDVAMRAILEEFLKRLNSSYHSPPNDLCLVTNQILTIKRLEQVKLLTKDFFLILEVSK